MTTSPLSPPDALSLDELNIVPEWLKAPPKSYEHHAGDDCERSTRRPGGSGGRDRERERRPRQPDGKGAPTGDRSPRHPDGQRRGPRRRAPVAGSEHAPQPATPMPLEVEFVPEEKGLGLMVETMKQSHRAYPLFDVAKLVLNKPERHFVKLRRPAGPDGARPSLFQSISDEAVFLNEDDALRHALQCRASELVREDKQPCNPPKGNFTFVSRCGFTGEILGPPNHHEYQRTLVRHHQERLRHIPFDRFQSRIETVTDPEVVKRWVEARSFQTRYFCRLCAEVDAKPVESRLAVERHLRERHLAQLVRSAPEVQVRGVASRHQPVASIGEAIRIAWIREWRFPLRTAQMLSARLRQEAFHFFKHHKTVTYVTFTKLKRFDTLSHLKEGIQKIITFLRAYPDSTRRKLMENLLPAGTAAGSPEEAAFLADLHWLIFEGYVVEFADGKLWALDNRPPKSEAPATEVAMAAANAAEPAPNTPAPDPQ